MPALNFEISLYLFVSLDPKPSIVRWLMRSLVCPVCGDAHVVPFYLWWRETTLKDKKISKYFVAGFRYYKVNSWLIQYNKETRSKQQLCFRSKIFLPRNSRDLLCFCFVDINKTIDKMKETIRNSIDNITADIDRVRGNCTEYFEINPLSAKPTKCSYTLKQFVGCCRQIVWICLTIFWGWQLRGLKRCIMCCLLFKLLIEHLLKYNNDKPVNKKVTLNLQWASLSNVEQTSKLPVQSQQ